MPKQFQDPPPSGTSDYARLVWLAGLGALVKSQGEGGRLFEALVDQGRDVETRGKQLAEEQVKVLARKIRQRTTGAAVTLEEALQNRIAHTLHRLGVPTEQDLRTLATQVADLNATLQELLHERKSTSRSPTDDTV